MGKVGQKFVIILDINRVLSVDDLALLAEAGEGDGTVIEGAARRVQ
jgi:hypothetical protein